MIRTRIWESVGSTTYSSKSKKDDEAKWYNLLGFIRRRNTIKRACKILVNIREDYSSNASMQKVFQDH